MRFTISPSKSNANVSLSVGQKIVIYLFSLSGEVSRARLGEMENIEKCKLVHQEIVNSGIRAGFT